MLVTTSNGAAVLNEKWPNKNPPITYWSGGKPATKYATFHNEIRLKENNLILILSGQTKRIILKTTIQILYNNLRYNMKFLYRGLT
jgi:hypothetical protein